MTLRAQIGMGAALLLLVVLAGAAFFLWKRPLAFYAMQNRRALSTVGFERSEVASSLGPQSVWTGGSGSTVVLLHGAGDTSATYAKVADKLVSRYRVIIPDLAGHGRSAPAEGPIAVGQVLAGLEAVMQQVSKEPSILVGNSLGAWVALLYAKAHPDRVARLVLVNGGALTGERPDINLVPRTRDEAAAVMRQLRDPGAPPVPGFVLDDVVREAASGPLARIAQTASSMQPYLLDGRLHEILTPVDLLWGESDQLFPLTYARRMMAALPSSRLTPISSCGHVPQQECPARFVSALLEVLAAPAPAAPPLPRAHPAPGR